MNVIDVSCKVVIVSNGVLPEASLPKRQVAVRTTTCDRTNCNHVAAEISLDAPPAFGVIRIARREGEYCVQVIRQDHNRVDRKRTLSTGCTKRRTQRADVIDKVC